MKGGAAAITHPDPADIPERARGAILAQWKELVRLRGKALKSPESEAIHDLRVASRRFRAAVELFEPWMAHKNAARLKKSLRKMTRALGGVRNIDEAQLFFLAHPPAEPARRSRLRRALSKMRPAELARVKKALASFDRRSLSRSVQRAAAGVESRLTGESRNFPLPPYFSDTCERLFQPIQELLPDATSRERRASRHALRIAIKKCRYFLEIIAPVVGYDCRPAVELLREYQTILGRMNDVVVFGALCDDLALPRRERGFVEGILKGEEELLLKDLTELIEQKPLACTPLLPT